ncbi:DUF1634 domain-containing protein [Bordetella bronchiseptica]|uniref:PF07843 domain protein n=2 Tax=Bordetella bronchiseptica TaxID=518 RepID=A0ABR4RHB3_BORBO|nr:DUF1634 domain-containing protein [Bordetella bronchiseptica]SHR17941.1 Predicted membrane protein [Mycobacteroides abscessus subsp. abscessus]AZW20778.1 DUF1634 domain-containing protein [Bordetella bronchiseptica]KCV35513.1 PF07843 domain protein [Bordetella bronchiseptica 00-P-2796]KDC04372.1 PF07843 domain protein [Bordetella bronchiseptica E013]CCJ54231.1 putative membrane protein [Bordetella bronchiseptica 253]
MSARAGAGLEIRLAVLLRAGTWAACLIIAAGLLLGMIDAPAGARVVNAGIVLFIALPAARLLAMLAAFARQRDWRYALIVALVLAIIAAGLALGLRAG